MGHGVHGVSSSTVPQISVIFNWFSAYELIKVSPLGQRRILLAASQELYYPPIAAPYTGKMPTNINDLPYELFSRIIDLAIRSNEDQDTRTRYYLHRESKLQRYLDVRMQLPGKGVPNPDSVRWAASNTIRQVGSRWHEVALKYAFKGLYVLPDLDSEEYTHSENLECSCFLRKTVDFIENHPTVSFYIQRIWFSGCYETRDSDMILRLLRHCKKLQDVWVPWTVLRHGTVAHWSSLFGSNAAPPCITSLVIQAVGLPKRRKRYAAVMRKNRTDNKMLESASVDFSSLAILRILGNSQTMTIVDEDLIALACTANNLREIHISNASPVGPKGIAALVRSSQSRLEELELDDFTQMLLEQPEQHDNHFHHQLSRLVGQCPLLRRLRLQSIRTCSEMLACDDLAWSGEVQIYIGANSSFQVPQPDDDTTTLFKVLDQARSSMGSRTRNDGKPVEVKIFASGFMFEPRCGLVHGNFPATNASATTPAFRAPWLAQRKESHQEVQMAYYVRALPFCVTEDEFRDGLDKGHIWL